MVGVMWPKLHYYTITLLYIHLILTLSRLIGFYGPLSELQYCPARMKYGGTVLLDHWR